MTVDQPPNFFGNYPLDGERIGPAWRAAWSRLTADPSRWHTADELAELMVDTSGVVDKTARNLLRQARQRGLLAVRYTSAWPARGRRSSYRIP